MSNIIEVKDLDLTLGKTEILKKINVSFADGRIHGLIGRNGSGKTMLMKCICGFIKPTRGEVIVDGKRVGKDVDFPKDMGIIIETPGFIPYYSGYKNLKLLAGLNHRIGKEQVRESMRMVGPRPGSEAARSEVFPRYAAEAGACPGDNGEPEDTHSGRAIQRS